MARTPVNRARCHLAGYRTAIGRDLPRAAPRGTAGPPGRRPRPARPTGRGELHVRATAAGRDVGEPVARGPVDGEAPADPGRRPLGWVSERRARGRGQPRAPGPGRPCSCSSGPSPRQGRPAGPGRRRTSHEGAGWSADRRRAVPVAERDAGPPPGGGGPASRSGLRVGRQFTTLTESQPRNVYT